ncbi:hypothetical protein ACFX12_004428 [Malus domestica]
MLKCLCESRLSKRFCVEDLWLEFLLSFVRFCVEDLWLEFLLSFVKVVPEVIILGQLHTSIKPLVIFSLTFSETQTFWGLIASQFSSSSTSVRSVLISTLVVGAVVVFVHDTFKVPKDLFLYEQEPSPSTGFFSFLNSVTPYVAVSTSPAVVAACG